MRRAFDKVKLLGDGDVFYGISLGYDFCAEHEWGIEKMRRKFGIDNSNVGVDGRTITKGTVLFKEDDGLCVLTSYRPYSLKDDYTAKDILAYDIPTVANQKDIETAWDESDFCIATKNKDMFGYLKELYNAFQTQNIVISFLSPSIPAFENASLSVLIRDRLPKEVTDLMWQADKKALDLITYEKEIGVTELKEKNRGGYGENKYFMECSPRWIDYEDPENREKVKKELGTQYNIRFWVNYSDDDNNYGWYNAEDIIKWLSTPGLKLKSLNKEK
jgi:hypothetical protein